MNNFDKIIKDAFKPSYSPSSDINIRILKSYEQKGTTMKKTVNIRKAFVTVCMIMICAVPVYAAVNFLTPSQVAERTGDRALAAAFDNENAVTVNETQHTGGYNVTLMGLVSGESIADNKDISDGQIYTDKTYGVVAIEKDNGEGFADRTEVPQIYISPYIHGNNPMFVNMHSLNGGYYDFVQDGIFYRLIDCDNIEIFADQIVYLGVSEGVRFDSKAFEYSEETGTITARADFDGMNALFRLPLDASKADPEKAAETIKAITG